MINKNIEEITKDDLQALINNGVLERKTLEYKQSLPGNSDSDKKEFLADVTSFANTSGGDLIFGIIEDSGTGIPTALQGLNITNTDEEKVRLDNLIRTGVQPRLPQVNIVPIPLDNSKVVLIIRVQKSWISPHRVTLGGHDKFYSRNSSGKYPLDVGELRIAFNLSETIIEKIRHFNIDRVSKILDNDTPMSFHYRAKITLHLIPLISFYPAQYFSIDIIASNPGKMPPIYARGWNHRYNLDGFLTYSEFETGKIHSYVQLFRNGIIEAVEGELLNPERNILKIPSVAYEEKLINSLNIYLSILKELNVEPPIFVFLKLFGVKGYSMGINPARYLVHNNNVIDRDILSLPEIIVDKYEDDITKLLKPAFDSIWNACGFQRSYNYNEQGEWAPR